MAQNVDKNKNQERESPGVIPRNISAEMRESYLDYAMSVITARALPDVRDGLKPVHRRILFTMKEMNLVPSAKFRKSAAVVGEVLGKYHPHGDVAVYDSMVKMGQDFSHRYPLVLGQGNFGSLDGDSPAAMRYTEAKLSRVAEELLHDIEKETVDWRPNYDGTRKEPTVLPSALPNILLNGGLGIAVGMATNIPPHNLREVVDATSHLIDNRDATTDDLLAFVKGPDFPTGGVVFNRHDIHHAYANGKGGVVVRGEAEITEGARGTSQIVITSIPYRVNKADLVARIAELYHEKKLDGMKDVRDESTRDIRVVVELKAGAHPQKVLNNIYKHTSLEDTFHYNMVCLVNGVPQTLSLKGILEAFVGHRVEVVTRRTQFDLIRAEDREHILLGLKKALDHIDKIIALIKKSKDVPTAHAELQKEFGLSDRQATAILEMKLQRLAGLERTKIEDELLSTQELITGLKELLASEKKIRRVVKKELAEAAEKHGDERKTKIISGEVKSFSAEDLIPEEENVVVLTAGGYIKRTNPDEYKRQHRGGVGVVDLNTKEEDVVTTFIAARTHSDLLFFTDRGKVYRLKVYEVPEGKRATKGKSIMNFLSLSTDETVTSVRAIPSGGLLGKNLLMVTTHGIAKCVGAEAFSDVRRSGLLAITLKGDDKLVAAHFLSDGDEVIVATALGKGIRFKQKDVRAMGRTARGVRVMRLKKGDEVIAADVVSKAQKDTLLLVLTENGYGKKTKLSEFKVQKRGGRGIKTAQVTNKTGRIAATRVIREEDKEIVAISQKGQVVRIPLAEVSTLGRATQGVRIMKPRAGDKLASAACL